MSWEKKGTAGWTECVGEMGEERYISDGQSVWVRWEKKGTAGWTECVGEMGDDRYS